MRLPIEVEARRGQMLGMTPARFLRDYWQKHPLLIRNAFPDFVPPLTPDDLAGLACEEFALSRIILQNTKAKSLDSGFRAARGPGMTTHSQSSSPRKRDKFVRNEFGQPEVGPKGKAQGRTLQSSDFEQWKLRSGPFTESDFAQLPESHWTLLVQDVDKWDADVAALLTPFDFLPSWRIDDVMVSYATDGGGVGAHLDQYDVFLLQGIGQRHWRISAEHLRIPRKSPHVRVRTSQFASHEFRADTELKLLKHFEPTHASTLDPGDMLYLPPGVPHDGVAIGECMTFSIGMRAPASAELLVEFAEQVAAGLPESQRYADPDLRVASESGEIDRASLQRARAALGACAQAMDEQTFADFFGRFITAYRSAQVVAPPPRKIGLDALDRKLESSVFVRNPWSRIAWQRAPRGATLYVAGVQHRCPLAWARALGGARRIEGAALAKLPQRAAGVTLLAALMHAGHLAMRPR